MVLRQQKQQQNMETMNEKIRNRLSPIKNVVALIEEYENATSGEAKRIIVEHIVKSKDALQTSIDKLINL